MQKFEFLRQPRLGELAMSRKKEPRAAHALRSDKFGDVRWYFVGLGDVAETNRVLVRLDQAVIVFLWFILIDRFFKSDIHQHDTCK